ncbi:UDP-galactose transporter senju-like [Ptychodera flava]|uniref:UDP-galactose transporter senju-like n=1 Tax=Ptychodera flava TaxID=63121 RepID=UPI00396A6742
MACFSPLWSRCHETRVTLSNLCGKNLAPSVPPAKQTVQAKMCDSTGSSGEMARLANLFPTRLSAAIFVAYIALFVNQGILVTATKDENNKYPYNTTTVVLMTECTKLVTAVVLFVRSNSFLKVFSEIRRNVKVLLLYFVPAGLYCLYNNLQFVNLAEYDPTTYYLLLQFRVVVTGITFQLLFNRILSSRQWLSLLLLTLGCLIKQLKQDITMKDLVTFGGQSGSFHVSSNLVLMLLQVFCSCFAGVYNEYLLKGQQGSVDIWMQNIFMYFDSIACNLLVLAYTGDLRNAYTEESIRSILTVKVVAIIINYAAVGIVTSLFLRSLNSILKTFASAMELMFTAVLCWIIFGIKIDVFTVLAIAVVSFAIYLYSMNPVINVIPVSANKRFRKQSEYSNDDEENDNGPEFVCDFRQSDMEDD